MSWIGDENGDVVDMLVQMYLHNPSKRGLAIAPLSIAVESPPLADLVFASCARHSAEPHVVFQEIRDALPELVSSDSD